MHNPKSYNVYKGKKIWLGTRIVSFVSDVLGVECFLKSLTCRVVIGVFNMESVVPFLAW